MYEVMTCFLQKLQQTVAVCVSKEIGPKFDHCI